MGLIKHATQSVFDLSLVQRGDCIRFRRAGDTVARNGFVTEAKSNKLTILYCNVQNNACSYIDIKAADVALGIWDIFWTQDFQTIYHEGKEDEESEEDEEE